MEKAQKNWRYLLIAGTLSCAVAVISTALVAFFWLKSSYVVMAIMLFLSVVSIYSILFCFFAAHEAALAVRIIPIFMENCEYSDTDRIDMVSRKIGWKDSATDRFLLKCKKRGYIENK